MAKKKKRAFDIPNPKVPPKKENEKVVVLENEFNIDFFYKKWMGSTGSFYRAENFSNYLEDMAEFEKNIMIIMLEYFPKICADYDVIFNPGNRYGNCHPVAKNKLDLVIDAIKDVHKDDVAHIDFDTLNSDGYEWWYLGFKQDIRIIGLFNKNKQKFLPMLIDHHHLIHGNEYYNQKDYGQYKYCPIVNFEQVNASN